MIEAKKAFVLTVLLACFFTTGAFADSFESQAELRSNYEELHRHPELGKQEFKSAEFIRGKLKQCGYKDLLTVEAAPTTVIAILKGKNAGPCICFRADMDARKCSEDSGVNYKSLTDGIMHNCGHDAHTAILLETARRLMLQKEKIAGQIVFLFQPAEECAGGADEIVADGVLKRLGVEAIFAQHCAPGIAVGVHTLGKGPVLAGSTTIELTVSGRGGHAAQAHMREDLSGLASLLTLELQKLPSRCLDPIKEPAIIAITNSNWSSTQVNVAPESITLAGTIRTFFRPQDKLVSGKSLQEHIEELVSGLAAAYGAKAELKLKERVPVTENDAQLCERIKTELQKSGLRIEDQERSMFAEDFAYYTPSIKSAYFGLGIARDSLGKENVHSSKFTIHEDCLESGVELFLNIAKTMCK